MTSAPDPGGPVRPANCPLRLGTAEEFARVRTLLAGAGYDDASLRRALGIADIADLVRVDWDKAPLATLAPALRLCLDLFVRIKPIPMSELSAVWGVETVAAFVSLGLLRPSRRREGHAVAAVWLSPVAGLVVASDLSRDPDGDPFEQPDDAVFPAIDRVTLQFLQLLPDTRGDALDLCGGSGVGVLHLARTARSAITADITPRSAFFAAFNGSLNDRPIVSRCGDLYAPVAGQQFDLITAHPPYVPDVGEHAIYRDGGESGETITRRVIEGLVQHLRPGGTGVIVGFARDTNAQPFEQRARDWLGTAAREFDLLFGTDQSQSIEQVVEAQRPRLKGDVDGEVQRLIQRLCDLDTRQFVHGALYVRRTPTAVDDAPLRVRITPQVRPADFDRLLAWRERRRKPGFRDWLADARPHLAPRLELLTRHAVENGELKVSNVLFQIEDAFAVNLRVDTWMVPAISRHNGKRSVVEVFQAAQAAGEFPDGFPLEAFVGLVDTMIERGFLRLDGNTAPCA